MTDILKTLDRIKALPAICEKVSGEIQKIRFELEQAGVKLPGSVDLALAHLKLDISYLKGAINEDLD